MGTWLSVPWLDADVRIVRALDPAEVWLAHTHEPWRPGTGTSATGSPHPAGRPE